MMISTSLLKNVSTQYSVMTYMGKESKKRVGICICINDSLCCTPETNTILYINYMPIKIIFFNVYKSWNKESEEFLGAIYVKGAESWCLSCPGSKTWSFCSAAICTRGIKAWFGCFRANGATPEWKLSWPKEVNKTEWGRPLITPRGGGMFGQYQ